MSEVHPFDEYEAYTDLHLLKEYSEKPLRKCIRVNTLKRSVASFKEYADSQNWSLKPVEWCKEAFYIDREDRSQALGKDLLQITGHFYIQEAASMLPVALLDPQPGETILDLTAAPGSKTTQIAAAMQGNGAIIANDIQEKRLWTLKTAIHRLGAHNVNVVKKMAQWYGNNMTERFDRVLCDAPCSAQGTSRKDPTALKYCSKDNITKMASLQFPILESAIHATKVGGRIVYSTCTLTKEENEAIIMGILNKYSDQIKLIDAGLKLDKAKKYSEIIQKDLGGVVGPMIRLWPHLYNTEGFFCAVLEKRAPTKHPENLKQEFFQEVPLPKSKRTYIEKKLAEQFGTGFLEEQDRLFARGEQIILTNAAVANCSLPTQNYALGIPFGKYLSGKRIRVSHELSTLRGDMATKQRMDLSEKQLTDLLEGRDTDCDASLYGDTLLFTDGMCIGRGLAKNGHLKNNLPRTMIGLTAG